MNWVLLLAGVAGIFFFHETGHYAAIRGNDEKICFGWRWFGPVLGVKYLYRNVSVFRQLFTLMAGFAFSLPFVFLFSFFSLRLFLVLFFVSFFASVHDFYVFFQTLFLMHRRGKGLDSPIDEVRDYNLGDWN